MESQKVKEENTNKREVILIIYFLVTLLYVSFNNMILTKIHKNNLKTLKVYELVEKRLN